MLSTDKNDEHQKINSIIFFELSVEFLFAHPIFHETYPSYEIQPDAAT